MARYRKNDREPEAPGASRYDDELLSANWNPVVDLLEWSCAKTLQEVSDKPRQDLTEEDADALLSRIYTLGY